jgi:hypothetical protein
MEGGRRASVSYPALVRRYRAIANLQTPPLSDRQMGTIIANYIRSGAMPAPLNQGPNAMFLAEIGRVVGSVEVARSQSFALELEMILHLLQTGTLTFEQAFARGSAVNPMTIGEPQPQRAPGGPKCRRARGGRAARPEGQLILSPPAGAS